MEIKYMLPTRSKNHRICYHLNDLFSFLVFFWENAVCESDKELQKVILFNWSFLQVANFRLQN